MLPDRRHFLEMVGIAAVAGSLPPRIGAVAEERSADVGTEPADYTIRIGTGTLELAPDHIVSTMLYNVQFPGPLIRFKEGQLAVVDIYNDTDVPELVHGGGRHALRACAGSGSALSQNPQASASITPMFRRGPTSIVAPIRAGRSRLYRA
jgi:FtsP/CotA-like multicopper oxidase with cupredoxin domain